MSKEIKEMMPKAIIKGNTQQPRSGAFEVTIDGALVYSKFKTGDFPNVKEIKSWF